MKIIFAGTPELAVPSLQALINSEHEIVAVYTKPDQPAGRGQKLTMSPVKQLALKHHLTVRQPLTLRDAKEQALLGGLNADLMIVIAYGLLLPPAVLAAPRLGCVNSHVSLLPRWRGAAPIQHAILAGDNETGITLMQMDEGLDTGPVLYQLPCPLLPADTSKTLHDRLAQLSARAILDFLPAMAKGNYTAQPQDETRACYAGKIAKEDAQINWRDSAATIERQIRAFNPWPVAYTHLDGQFIRIWQAGIIKTAIQATPGAIIHTDKNSIHVATGEHALQLLELQLAGGRCLPVSAILNSKAEWFAVGKRFGQ